MQNMRHERAQSNQEAKRKNNSLKDAALREMQKQAIDEEEEQHVEPTHESIDLPITTSENIDIRAIGDGLKRPNQMNDYEENKQLTANDRVELIVDSEDLPDDEEEEEDDYAEDQFQLPADESIMKDNAALIEES